MTGSLVQKAMLVDLHISQVTKTRTDKRATNRTVAEHHAQDKSLRVVKNLFHPSSTAELDSLVSQIRAVHESLTLPWNRAGVRILSTAAFTEYSEKVRGIITQIDEAADVFAYQKLQQALVKAEQMLGDAWNPDEYPTAEEVCDSYRVRVQFYPVPSAGDFRVEIADADLAAIRAEMERQGAEDMKAAMGTLWTELRDGLDDLTTKIYGGDVSKASIEALLRKLDRAGKLNVAGDARLEDMIKDLRGVFGSLDAEDLRADSTFAEQVIDKADDLATKMEDYFM
jgi:hypothetical protein